MTTPANHIFEFGPFRLDTAERVLLRDGQPVPLTLKAFDVCLSVRPGFVLDESGVQNFRDERFLEQTRRLA
jgi:DNA-binding winged helix-turn-helix (wHTH) protein